MNGYSQRRQQVGLFPSKDNLLYTI